MIAFECNLNTKTITKLWVSKSPRLRRKSRRPSENSPGSITQTRCKMKENELSPKKRSEKTTRRTKCWEIPQNGQNTTSWAPIGNKLLQEADHRVREMNFIRTGGVVRRGDLRVPFRRHRLQRLFREVFWRLRRRIRFSRRQRRSLRSRSFRNLRCTRPRPRSRNHGKPR